MVKGYEGKTMLSDSATVSVNNSLLKKMKTTFVKSTLQCINDMIYKFINSRRESNTANQI